MGSEIRQLTLATGIQVPCFIHGDAAAKPLLLVHAWGESHGSFDRLIPRLPGFRVFAPDLRGQGGADKTAAGYSLAEQAADIAAILDAVDVTKACVLGSSSGGYVAQQVALEYPRQVAALVLAGSPLSLQGRPSWADDIDKLSEPVSTGWVRESLAWFPLHHGVPAWFIEERIRDGAAMPAYVWKALLAGLCSAPPPTDSGTIAANTLILWGEHDEVLSRTDQESLAARIAGSVLKVYPNTGHLVLWECPEQLAADTTVFLDAID